MKNSSNTNSPGRPAVLAEPVLLIILTIAVPLIVALDVIVLKHGLTEFSVTEVCQSVLLLMSTVLVGSAARKQTGSRGFLVLLTGFLGAMFIRENDKFMDFISQGFWFYPAMLVGAGSIIYAMRHRDTVIQPAIRFTNTKSYTYLLIGLVLVILFSRVFGTGRFWMEVMGADYNRLYKAIIQEGVELLGYVFILIGCVHNHLQPPQQQS